jgi:hypothetical protein
VDRNNPWAHDWTDHLSGGHHGRQSDCYGAFVLSIVQRRGAEQFQCVVAYRV